MGVGAGLSMYVVVVQKFTFAISSPDEFLSNSNEHTCSALWTLCRLQCGVGGIIIHSTACGTAQAPQKFIL